MDAAESLSAPLAWSRQLELLVLAGGRRPWLLHSRRLAQQPPSPVLAHLAHSALLLQTGQYSAVLTHPTTLPLFSFLATSPFSSTPLTPSTLSSSLSTSITSFLTPSSPSPSSSPSSPIPPLPLQLHLLFTAIALLQSFVALNYTASPSPPTPPPSSPLLSPSSPLLPSLTSASLSLLRLDGEDLHECAHSPHLLYFAYHILFGADAAVNLGLTGTRGQWGVRLLAVLHAMLEHNTATISAHLDALLPSFLSSLSPPAALPTSALERLVTAKLHLSLAPLLLQYWRYNEAQQSLDLAQSACGLEVQVEGVMGKRTRWQRELKSQLVVQIVRVDDAEEAKEEKEADAEDGADEVEDEKYMPTVQPLQSDVLLPSLALVSATPSPSLSPIQRALLLSIVNHLRVSTPSSHTSTRSTLLAYLSLILSSHHRRSWSIEQTALYLQSVLELDDHHLIDRALGQLEDLSHSLHRTADDTHSTTAHGDADTRQRIRMEDVHEGGWMSEWALKLSVAARFEKLGLTRSALELYESVGWMDGIIDMNVALERRSVAEALIHDKLAQQPTPKLLCLLGDLTRDPSKYEEAWTLSSHSYPRAQRSLSRHYRDAQQWAASIEHSQLALALNPVSPMEWFSLGHCALQLSDHALGVVSFSKVVAYDPEYADGWNNLAACHLHLHAWSSALTALDAATKLSFDSWKVWENTLTAALHTHNHTRAIQAIERILTLKAHAKAVDKDASEPIPIDVVERLTAALLPLASATADDRWLGERWGKALATLTARITTDPRLWRCVAQWRAAEGSRVQAVQAWERAYQAALLPVPASHPSVRARYSAYELEEGRAGRGGGEGGGGGGGGGGEVVVWTGVVWKLDEAMAMMEELLRCYEEGGIEGERLAGRLALEAMEEAVRRKGSAAVRARWEERKADVDKWKGWMQDTKRVQDGGTAAATTAESSAAGNPAARLSGLHSSYADMWR